jgi:biotin transport system permease protein
VLRLTLLLLLGTWMTLTVRVSALMEAIEQGLEPLRRWGVNPAQVSLMVSMALRFVPLLSEQLQEIKAAQRARGLEGNTLALMVPFLVKTLRMADDLTDALEARGYDPED